MGRNTSSTFHPKPFKRTPLKWRKTKTKKKTEPHPDCETTGCDCGNSLFNNGDNE